MAALTIVLAVAQLLVLIYTFVLATMNMVRVSGVRPPMVLNVVAMIGAVLLMIRRDTYLPFLGHAAFPPSLIKDKMIPDKANVQAILNLKDAGIPDGTKIAYWGANPSKKTVSNPRDAYKDYKNAGVTQVMGGKAVIVFHCPSKYQVQRSVTLDRHVHYRVVNANGLMGPVETQKVNCE